ncbi:MAG: peptidylprolyl isomerase [Burkholderiales bacterium]|jgi:peptidyl-prolyl cis-trans isomerase C
MAIAALFTMALSAPANAADEATDAAAADNANEAVATVNGVIVPKSQFEMLLESQVSQGQEDTQAFREELREIMITREVLVQEAKRREMNQSAEFKTQVDAMKQQLLITMLFNAIIEEMEPTEEALQAEYERLKQVNASMGEKEYHVRHILVEDQAQATTIIEELGNGADFAELAMEYSTDTGSKSNGGDLGWATRDRYVKPFADAMVALQKGELSATPVKSNFGYHIIEVIDIRPRPFPPFEQVKEQLRKEMLTTSRDALITKLRDESKIEKIGELKEE